MIILTLIKLFYSTNDTTYGYTNFKVYTKLHHPYSLLYNYIQKQRQMELVQIQHEYHSKLKTENVYIIFLKTHYFVSYAYFSNSPTTSQTSNPVFSKLFYTVCFLLFIQKYTNILGKRLVSKSGLSYESFDSDINSAIPLIRQKPSHKVVWYHWLCKGARKALSKKPKPFRATSFVASIRECLHFSLLLKNISRRCSSFIVRRCSSNTPHSW